MRVLLSTDQRAQDWCDLLKADGHTVSVLPLGAPAAGATMDVCLVLTSTPAALRSQCFWLATLTLPTLLITPALISAQALCRRLPLVRVICHPSRAVTLLGELLLMTAEVRAGLLVLDARVTTARSAGTYRGRYAHS